MIKHRKNLPPSPAPSGIAPPVCTTQFGASLQFIKENNGGDPIPPIVRQCVDFLKTPEGKNPKERKIRDTEEYKITFLSCSIGD